MVTIDVILKRILLCPKRLLDSIDTMLVRWFPQWTAVGYSRWRDRSLHLCFKTVRATFAAHGSSVICPLLQVSVWLSPTAPTTCDLTFRASPLQGIAPSRLHAGSSAFLALLLLITYTSPSSRQLILGITPGLCFLRNPSPYALRLAPAPMVSESTYEVTPFPMAMARIRRAVLSTGFLGSAGRSVLTAAGALSCAVLAPAHQPLPLGKSDDGFTTPLLALPIDAC